MPPTPDHDRSTRRIPTLAPLAVLLAAFITVLTHDVQHDNGLTAIDPEISAWAIEHRTATLTATARVVTTLGDTLTLTIITVLVCAGLIWRGCRRDATLVALTAVGASILTFAGKRLIGRSRPPAVDRIAFESSLSYPSGHSLGSIAVIGIVVVALVPRLHRTAARLAAITAAVVFVVAVGISRVYLGVHWPTDVLGGWSIGALWILVCLGAYTYLNHRWRDHPVRISAPRDGALTNAGPREPSARDAESSDT
ncbi:phosphatase PAP2 family protein [Nocardia sp. NPDC005366]|uniref:phosphatase PAP2 family protein n=1 Tax=Nocardia sp. NPDC005366 TaxID=3156878 RepID=UPI0033B0655D